MNLGPLDSPACLSCGASPDRHQPDCAGDETWEAANPPLPPRRLMEDYAAETAEIAYRQGRESGKRRGREDVLHALSNFAGGQELAALDETNPDARRGRLFVIEHIRALIAVEAVRP